MALLELQGVKRNFGATAALAGVDLKIAAGEVHAIIGENGAGKSTLLNVLSGAFAQDSGELRFDGQRYSPRGPAEAREQGIVHIHQELSLCPHLTVAENISLGLEPGRFGLLDRQALLSRARNLLEDFGCTHINAEVAASTLSLPDQQAVEICRALASRSRIILMDEPTSSLTRHSVEQLFRLIRRLREQGIAVIYISHFLEEVREVAERFTVLRDGKSVATGLLSDVRDDQLIAHMVGREGEGADLFGRDTIPRTRGESLLSARDLASPPKVKSASFELHRGEIFGVGGLVGSGRTELVRALFGLVSSTGEVRLRGEILKRAASSADQIFGGMGYLSEDRKHEGLYLQLPVADNLTATGTGSISHAGWIDLNKQKAVSEEIISALNIRSARPALPVARLSGGNQQKVAFGRLLHQDPDILLLDEPTRGIDIRSKADIYREIRQLAGSGKAILMVSSYLPELFGICDRIAVMARGVLSPARNVSEWTPHSIMQAAISEMPSLEAH